MRDLDRTLRTSLVRPGREHDTTCARTHAGLLDTLTDWTDGGPHQGTAFPASQEARQSILCGGGRRPRGQFQIKQVPLADEAASAPGQPSHRCCPAARTKRPAVGLASVTVLGRSLLAGDVDATAAFALRVDGEHWLATRGHQGILIVRADGSTVLR